MNRLDSFFCGLLVGFLFSALIFILVSVAESNRIRRSAIDAGAGAYVTDQYGYVTFEWRGKINE